LKGFEDVDLFSTGEKCCFMGSVRVDLAVTQVRTVEILAREMQCAIASKAFGTHNINAGEGFENNG
jgi:hypothetical protein